MKDIVVVDTKSYRIRVITMLVVLIGLLGTTSPLLAEEGLICPAVSLCNKDYTDVEGVEPNNPCYYFYLSECLAIYGNLVEDKLERCEDDSTAQARQLRRRLRKLRRRNNSNNS